MRYPLLVASAVCVLAGAPAGMAQVAQEPASRQQGETPIVGQEPSPPESPAPGDTRDYQTPAETSPIAPDTPPGTPATPPGAPETPSRSPVTDPADVEPSAGAPQAAGVPPGYQTVSAYLEEEGNKRRDLVGRPVATLAGERVGEISEFVVRSSRHYAHLSLEGTQDSPAREVVVSLDKLHAGKGSEVVIVEVQDRSELEDLPRYDPANFQTVR